MKFHLIIDFYIIWHSIQQQQQQLILIILFDIFGVCVCVRVCDARGEHFNRS